MNEEVKKNPEAETANAEQPAAPAAAPTVKKPWYKRASIWTGVTICAAAAGVVAAWLLVGGNATGTTAADTVEA